MPCQSDYQAPTARENESRRVLSLLYEIGLRSTPPRLYGDQFSLDSDTAELCAWCKEHDVRAQSLELQIWWRDHQAADKLREESEAVQQHRDSIRRAALAKLTEEEKQALGLKAVL